MVEELIRSTLVENLMGLYPDGPPADEKQIRIWLQEIVGSTINNGTSLPSTTAVNNTIVESNHPRQEIYEQAIAQAVEKWKTDSKEASVTAHRAKKPQQQSFSLFAQLDAASWGAPRITLDDLKSAISPEEHIKMLQKVAHVDDVALDWSDVSALLREGLCTLEWTEDYIELHRKWFDQGRASAEHWNIRCDLCQNIIYAIEFLIVGQWGSLSTLSGNNEKPFSAGQETLFTLFSLWNNMWVDLMQAPAGQDGTKAHLEKVGCQVMLLLKTFEGHDTSRCGQLLPAHFLALVDPSARWFKVWVAHMTPPRLFSLMQSGKFLPDLWQLLCFRAVNYPKDCQSFSSLFDAVLLQHFLSILNSILCCMRVKWFPASLIWETNKHTLKPVVPLEFSDLKVQHNLRPLQVNSEDEDGHFGLLYRSQGISEEQISQLFDIFLKIGTKSSTDDSDATRAKPLAALCANAIEVLLLGSLNRDCIGEEQNCFSFIWGMCQKHVTEATLIRKPGTFDALLFDIVQNVSAYLPQK